MKPHTVTDTVTRTHWTSFYPSFYLAGDSLTKGRGRPAEEFAGLLDVREDGTVPGVVGGALVDPFMAARVIKPRALEAVVTRAKRLSATEPAPIAVAAKRLVKRASLELPAIPDIDPFLDPELLPTPRDDDDDDDDEYHHHHHHHHDHGHEHGGSRVSGSSQSMLGTPLRMNGAASRLNLNLTSLTAADGGAGAHVGDGEREPYSARARPDGQAIVDGGLGATWPARSSVEGEGGAEGPPEPTEQYVMRVRCVRCVCVCMCVDLVCGSCVRLHACVHCVRVCVCVWILHVV